MEPQRKAEIVSQQCIWFKNELKYRKVMFHLKFYLQVVYWIVLSLFFFWFGMNTHQQELFCEFLMLHSRKMTQV